ncbi:hypothetical protein ACFY30_07595 [Streptomyces sp. NPDC000345]|uniref:hypothetical protein n=1 Tax=Streptomyces sp. NPDC000345 TaxID=3364537 RepID=UPI0036D148FA
MKRFVDEGHGAHGAVRRTGRAGEAGRRRYARAGAAARAGERPAGHRADRPTPYGTAAGARPGAGIDQPREAQA